MSVYRERGLQITIPDTINVRRFDDHTTHGLSHCMKAVDFILEEPNRHIFVEIKDPENPSSTVEDRSLFVQRFLSGRIDESLKYKYRDSFLYEWAAKRVIKDIFYAVLIAIKTMTEADLLARTDELKRVLPFSGPPSGVWKRPIVAGCAVFNIEAWNKIFPQYPVQRVSQ